MGNGIGLLHLRGEEEMIVKRKINDGFYKNKYNKKLTHGVVVYKTLCFKILVYINSTVACILTLTL